MKYVLRHWGDRTIPGYSAVTVDPVGLKPFKFDVDKHTAVFPCNYDPARTEAALDMAKKLVAYLNDLDTKINDIKTLMSIAKE